MKKFDISKFCDVVQSLMVVIGVVLVIAAVFGILMPLLWIIAKWVWELVLTM